MRGYFEQLNPSDYVRKYLEGKRKRDPKFTTERLKQWLYECAVSDIDTDVYGSILLLIELKTKRVYSTVYVDRLIQNQIKTIHRKAMISPEKYNRYAIFLRKHLAKVSAQIEFINKSTDKPVQELMQNDTYYKLVESYHILTLIRDDIKEVFYYHCPEKRPKENVEEKSL